MAIFNEILTGSLANILSKRLGMQTGSPSPSLAPEVMPVIALEVDRPEWSALGYEARCGGSISVAAAAGFFSGFRLINPTGSNTLAVVEMFQVQSAAVVTVETYQQQLPLLIGTAGTSTPLDTRLPSGAVTKNSVCSLSGDNTGFVPAIAGKRVWRVPANSLDPISLPIVLKPGTSIEFAGATVNTLVAGGIYWRERALVQGELI